ncbi:MAG: YcxB family protein, partial [Clostridia bacterium]|nr:YcxB family protein [Clostridia bacterium]
IISVYRGAKGAELVGAIVLFAAAPVVLFLTFYMSRKEIKNNAKSFGVDRGNVIMNYRFSPSSVLITRVAGGKTDRETLNYRDLYKVKRTKKFFLLFVNKDEMYYVPAKPEDFVTGSSDELFKTFYDAKVILDY